MKVGDDAQETASLLAKIKREIVPSAPAIRTALHHWIDLVSRNGRIPNRQAISPDAMATALPHIWLCDFNSADDRFRYRLGGEHVTSSLGRGMRGQYLDELTDPAVYPRVHAYFRKCVDLPTALHVSGHIYAEQSRVAIGERIMLPYCDDAGVVAGIFGATFRRWSEPNTTSDVNAPAPARRHVYFHFQDGRIEVEDVTLS